MNYLTHIGKDETGRSGCIAGTVKWPPTDISTVPGFAEIDPNGQFATDEEADQLAQYLAGCWNAFSGSGIPTAALTPGLVGEMVEALADARDGLRLVGNSMTEKTQNRLAAILAKLGKV